MSDEYNELTERLLPCTCNNRDGREGHFSSCAGYWREEVAAALREIGKERDDLRRKVERLKESTAVVLISQLRNQYDEQVKCNDALRAEIAALKDELERVTHDAVYHRVTVENQKEEIAALKVEVERLKHEWQQAKDAVAHLEQGKPLGELVGKQTIVNMGREIAALKAKLAPPNNDGQTHYEGCWKDRHHHACALDRLAELEAEQREQLEVLFAVGPITCRNGVPHEHQNVCLYCALAEAEKALKPIASWNLMSELSGRGKDHTDKDKLLDIAITLSRAALEAKP